MDCGSCPVTGGLPTRMTATCFAALCEAKRAAAGDPGVGRKVYGSVEAAAARKKMNICVVCRGKKRPAELEIIKMEELTMATKRGVCGSCDQIGIMVSPNHGVNMCSTCKTIHGNLKNHPETAAGAIKRLDLVDQYVSALAGDLVPVTVESLAMERIAALVGYEGKDGDELVAAVETMASSRLIVIKAQRRDADMLEEISDIMGSHAYNPESGFIDLVKDVREMVEANLAQLEREFPQPSTDVIRALGLPEGTTSWQTVEQLAIQTAALLEDAVSIKENILMDVIRLRQLVSLPNAPFAKVVDQVEHIVASIAILEGDGDNGAALVTASNRLIGKARIALHLLELASRCPGAKVFASLEYSHMVFFRFDGGEGVLMGLNPELVKNDDGGAV